MLQLAEMKKKLQENASLLETAQEGKKKAQHDRETVIGRAEAAEAEVDKMSELMKKLQQEVEDLHMAMEKRQHEFDQNLADKKATLEHLAMERDTAQAQILNQTQKLDELRDHLEAERSKLHELGDLMSSKDDLCKSVSKMFTQIRCLFILVSRGQFRRYSGQFWGHWGITRKSCRATNLKLGTDT